MEFTPRYRAGPPLNLEMPRVATKWGQQELQSASALVLALALSAHLLSLPCDKKALHPLPRTLVGGLSTLDGEGTNQLFKFSALGVAGQRLDHFVVCHVHDELVQDTAQHPRITRLAGL